MFARPTGLLLSDVCLNSSQGLQGQDNLTHREYKEDTSPGVEQNFIDNKKK